jgi:hypothetical protein
MESPESMDSLDEGEAEGESEYIGTTGSSAYDTTPSENADEGEDEEEEEEEEEEENIVMDHFKRMRGARQNIISLVPEYLLASPTSSLRRHSRVAERVALAAKSVKGDGWTNRFVATLHATSVLTRIHVQRVGGKCEACNRTRTVSQVLVADGRVFNVGRVCGNRAMVYHTAIKCVDSAARCLLETPMASLVRTQVRVSSAMVALWDLAALVGANDDDGSEVEESVAATIDLSSMVSEEDRKIRKATEIRKRRNARRRLFDSDYEDQDASNGSHASKVSDGFSNALNGSDGAEFPERWTIETIRDTFSI